MKRFTGVLLSVTSLPSKYGIGCFSKEAYKFVDWLAEAGQRYWQILPLGSTSHGGSDESPYQAFSAFAGNQNHQTDYQHTNNCCTCIEKVCCS